MNDFFSRLPNSHVNADGVASVYALRAALNNEQARAVLLFAQPCEIQDAGGPLRCYLHDSFGTPLELTDRSGDRVPVIGQLRGARPDRVPFECRVQYFWELGLRTVSIIAA